MAIYLNQDKTAGERQAADRQIRETVERILGDIEARGDVAIRELSAKFDNWQPANFALVRRKLTNA